MQFYTFKPLIFLLISKFQALLFNIYVVYQALFKITTKLSISESKTLVVMVFLTCLKI